MFGFVASKFRILMVFPVVLLLAMGWPSLDDDATTIIIKSVSLMNCRGCGPEGEPEGEGEMEGEPEGEIQEGEGEIEGEIEGEVEGESLEGEGGQEGEGEVQLPVVDIGTLVSVPAGIFKMGRPYTDQGFAEEVPVHEVSLDAYEIGKYPVTNTEFVEILNWALEKGYITGKSGAAYSGGLVYGYGQPLADTRTTSDLSEIEYTEGSFIILSRAGFNDQLFRMDNHPVVRVSWYGAVAYCNWLSEKEGLEPCYDTSNWERFEPVRNGYRLPTEAEWERAAAWDTAQERHWRFGVSSDELDPTHANHLAVKAGNPLGLQSLPYTSPVGWYDGKNPVRLSEPAILTVDSHSPVGAFDMAGNVWEWCHDFYGEDYYAVSPASNPAGPETGYARVLRGGAWNFDQRICRAAIRMRNDPDYRLYVYGFRVCISKQGA